MSHKNKDEYNRYRSKTVSFRVSPEEDEELNQLVSISGLSKQTYISLRLLEKEIHVTPNIRMQKGLMQTMSQVKGELERLGVGGEIPPRMQNVIEVLVRVFGELGGTDVSELKEPDSAFRLVKR